MKRVIRIAATGTYLTDTSPLSRRLVTIEPRPMATVKVAMMRFATVSSAPSSVCGEERDLGEEDDAQEPEPGNAENGEEHVLALARDADHAPGLAREIGIDLEVGLGRRGWRDAAAVSQAMTARPIMTTLTAWRPVSPMDEEAAEHGAEQDRQEGAHLDEAIAAEKLVLLEMLRQDRIFDRAEEGRLDAGQEDAEELQPDLIGEQDEGGERHRRRSRRT